jgi:hypothetical protein
VNRRDAIRRARRDLRAAGCRCHPTIVLLSAEHVAAVGARSGALVEHEPACPLGAAVKKVNDVGLTPAIVIEGCRR